MASYVTAAWVQHSPWGTGMLGHSYVGALNCWGTHVQIEREGQTAKEAKEAKEALSEGGGEERYCVGS